MDVLAIAGAILLLLTITKALNPRRFHFLPLGGSTIAEVGIVFGFAIATITIFQAIGAFGVF